MKNILVVAIALTFILTSCSTTNSIMREPNVRLELVKTDFDLSKQVIADARSTRILGIDFARIFHTKSGNVYSDASDIINIANIPVIGNIVVDNTANFALYELMSENPGYDFVLYPQYVTKVRKPILGIGFLLKISKVKVIARLGKLKN